MIRLCAFLLTVLVLTGCSTQANIPAPDPIYWGTVIEASPAYKRVTTSSTRPSAVGAVGGGIAGHQFGKGDGKKVMTGLGILVGSAALSTDKINSRLVPATAVIIRDDKSGETYKVMLEGKWSEGMKLQYSLYPSRDGSTEFELEVR